MSCKGGDALARASASLKGALVSYNKYRSMFGKSGDGLMVERATALLSPIDDLVWRVL